MARSTRRSTQNPSQSQSQSQRRRAAREPESDEDAAPLYEEDNEDEGARRMDVDDVDEEGGGGIESDLNRKANDLVRLALFNEQKRVPLKREYIMKKVLHPLPARHLPYLITLANATLASVFGMELVELRSRAFLLESELADKDKDKKKGGKGGEDEGTGLKKKSTPPTSKTYILRSTLPSSLLSLAHVFHPALLEAELDSLPVQDQDRDEDEEASNPIRPTGTILSWSTADQLVPVGVLYVVLALILVNGKEISDMDLQTHLTHLSLPRTTTLLLTAQSTSPTLPLQSYLTQLVRQGYLTSLSANANASSNGGRKRGRNSNVGGGEGGEPTMWRWGPRAHSEVGEKGVAGFVAEVMVGPDSGDDSDEDEGGEGGAEEKTKKEEKMVEGVKRAAGGELRDVL